ncbi:MAG TPA: hypothetical protein VEU97_07295 [Ktedonobacteraceae bacterium]|nr:hypothetical protein [Ktedonobacteraceae bacterium]
MLHLLTLSTIIADGVTIKIGDNVWNFGWNFIVYLIVAAVVGFIAEAIVGWRLPLGFVGAIIAALIGIWLMTRVILISGIGDIDIYGVPIIRALLGAIIFVAIWHLITYGMWRGRGRRAYRRA